MHLAHTSRDEMPGGEGQRGRYTRALVALTRAVWHEECTLGTALGYICEAAADALEVPRVNVWHYDGDRRELRCLHDYDRAQRHHTTRPEALETLTLADSDYIASLEVVRAIDVDDVDADPSTSRSVGALRDYLHRHHIRSLLDAPVLAEGRLVGVICHEQVDAKRVWTDEEVAFAGSMGDYVALAIEVQRRRDAERELDHLRLHDAATDLPNRDYLLELLGLRLRTAHDPAALADVGAVHLQIYLPYVAALAAGSHTFDDSMAAVAAALRDALGDGYNLARVRADAFAVLPRHPQPDRELVALAERCVSIVRELSAGTEIETGAAAGVAFARDLAERDARVMLRNAELASAHARAHGRYRYEIFDIDHHRDLMARLRLEQALRDALAQDRFRVLYQPEVDLRDDAWVGAEALLRWERDGRLVTAGEFIGAAESSGLILALGKLVLDRACREAAAWCDGVAHGPVLRVNVSAQQFDTASLVDDVAQALEDSGLPPSRLCLEVTETTLLRDAVQAAATMLRLKSLGVRLAIDDFGTGYSSFAYLKQFPVDALKIDRSFVSGLPADPSDMAVVRGIAGIGRDIGMEVVAEGVETRAQADALRAAGIVRAQGWLYAPAVEAARLREQLRCPKPHD
jgi:predicted signal transduction protein with EAL and GGDEF domain